MCDLASPLAEEAAAGGQEVIEVSGAQLARPLPLQRHPGPKAAGAERQLNETVRSLEMQALTIPAPTLGRCTADPETSGCKMATKDLGSRSPPRPAGDAAKAETGGKRNRTVSGMLTVRCAHGSTKLS